MLRAYLDGARLAAGRWLLATLLFLISAAVAVIFSIASVVWLTGALEGSMATRTLFKDFDPDVLVDLWYHHGEGLLMLGVVAAVLAVGHTIMWWWLHGVVILSVQRDEPPPPDRWRRALEVTPTMAQLFLFAIIALAVFSLAVGGPTYLLTRWTRSNPSPFIWYRLWAAAAAIWVLGAIFLIGVHDHARIRACRTRHGAVACYGWALGFVLRGGERAFPLAVLLQLTAAALWAGYQVVSLTLPTTEVLGVTGGLIWGAVSVWVRVWVRLWFFAAESALQS
jgi:hypothetical protein